MTMVARSVADDDNVTFEVCFPHGLTHSQAAQFFIVLGGQYRSINLARRQRPSVFAFELIATATGPRYALHTPRALADTTRRHLLTALPDVNLVPKVAPPTFTWTTAVELRVMVADTAAFRTSFASTLLSSFHGLLPGEAIMVQVVIAPMNVMGARPDSATLPCVIRLAIADPTRHGRTQGTHQPASSSRRRLDERSAELLERVVAAFRTVGLMPLPTRQSDAIRRVGDRAPALVQWPQVLSADSMAVIAGLPIGSPMVPGLVLGRGKQFAPDPAISTTGRRIAVTTFGGQEQPLTLSTQDRLRGLYVVGPLGSGKTTLLENIIADDLKEGAGLTLIDLKGGPTSLVERVLDVVPRHRIRDVCLFDLSDTSRPVGFNVLAGGNAVRTTSEVTSLLDRLFDLSTNTPRALDVLRSTVLTLAEADMTLAEASVILEPGPRGERFRDQVLADVTNSELINFWQWYRRLSRKDMTDVAAPISRRLRSLLLYPQLRLSLGQRRSGFDLDEILATNKVLLVPLGRGQLGDELAQLTGSLLVTQLWSAMQRRGREAKPHFVVIDEFQDLFRHIPTAVGEMTAQIRGYNGGLVLANQHIGQLSSKMRDEIFADVRSKVIFQTTLGTRELAGQMGQGVSAQDVESLGAHEVLASLHVDGQTRPAVTGRTAPPVNGPGLAQAVRAASRTRYGRPPEDVEAELAARHEPDRQRPAAARRKPVEKPPEPPAGWEPWDR